MKIKYFVIMILVFSSLSLAQIEIEILKERSKVIILSLRFEKNLLIAENVEIIYGSPPNRIFKENVLLFRILSDKGDLLDSYEVADSRFRYDVGYVENTSFYVVLPYIRTAREIDVFDKDQRIAFIDISDAFDSFCNTKDDRCDLDCKDDIDCPVKTIETTTTTEKPAQFVPDYSYLIIIVLLIIILTGLFYSYKRLKERKILKGVKGTKHK